MQNLPFLGCIWIKKGWCNSQEFLGFVTEDQIIELMTARYGTAIR